MPTETKKPISVSFRFCLTTISFSFLPQTNGHKSPVEEVAPTEGLNGNGNGIHAEAEVRVLIFHFKKRKLIFPSSTNRVHLSHLLHQFFLSIPIFGGSATKKKRDL